MEMENEFNNSKSLAAKRKQLKKSIESMEENIDKLIALREHFINESIKDVSHINNHRQIDELSKQIDVLNSRYSYTQFL
jgi:hypothetical protein